jgi:hypothetical protein
MESQGACGVAMNEASDKEGGREGGIEHSLEDEIELSNCTVTTKESTLLNHFPKNTTN